MSAARAVSRLRGRDGYSLVELVAVLAIFLTVMVPLVGLFTSGIRAETDASRRFEAQTNARVALDRLRRELHCSDGITATSNGVPVSSITVSLPSQCPSAKGVPISVVYDTNLVSANRWTVRRTQSGVTVVLADYVTAPKGTDPVAFAGKIFTYTPQSSTTRGLLRVDMPVNVYPNEGWKQWRLADDIVLRNTLRVDP